ncbi:hypothetical protein [Vibrio metschnikovii]|uniref:hypothetical protein n=1 Tax=Vibrio metschnikovii TaxID=28172 RepID=UPI002FCC55BD|nr:hypothetical protein [Vibrio metschnikovii]
MATLNSAVQAMIDNLHKKMTSDTPLTPEEQTLVAKALEALRNNYTWEQALVAIAEQHINESKAALTQALADTSEANARLLSSTDELVARYNHLLSVGRFSHTITNTAELIITPPENCRILITQLYVAPTALNNMSTGLLNARILIGGVPAFGNHANTSTYATQVLGKASLNAFANGNQRLLIGDPLNLSIGSSSTVHYVPPTHKELLLRTGETFSITRQDNTTDRIVLIGEYVTDK